MTAIGARQPVAQFQLGVRQRRDAGNDGETQPAAFSLGLAAHEARAQLLAQRRRHAGTVVRHGDRAADPLHASRTSMRAPSPA